MARLEKVLVIIPAFNEEENIEIVVEELKKVCPGFDHIVVNDGSTDRTAAICREHGYPLLDLPVNLGLAGCFQAGMKYAYQEGYDCAVQFDGDGQHRPEYIEPMRRKMEEGWDIVIGSRYLDGYGDGSDRDDPYRDGPHGDGSDRDDPYGDDPHGDGSDRDDPYGDGPHGGGSCGDSPHGDGSRRAGSHGDAPLRVFGSRLLSAAIKLTTGVRVTDPTSGMRMFSRQMIGEFALRLNYGPEPDTISYLLKQGAKVAEVPVVVVPRMGGESYLKPMVAVSYMSRMLLSILLVQNFRKR